MAYACVSGRHRSVVMARLTAIALRRLNWAKSVRCIHLCKHYWAFTRCNSWRRNPRGQPCLACGEEGDKECMQWMEDFLVENGF